MAIPHAKRRWTFEEFRALPEDSNKYEFIHGEVFVTPAPSEAHGDIVSHLNAILLPYVLQQGIGLVRFPRAVFSVGEEIEVEPDLMVVPEYPDANGRRTPVLVVEVTSPSTRRYDRTTKREVYTSNGIPEYWIIDSASQSVRIIQPNQDDRVIADVVTWLPQGAAEPLTFPVSKIFAPWERG